MTAPELFLDGRVALHAGDCLDVLRGMADASVDSVVTDPPYHLTSIVKRFGGARASACRDYSGENPRATGAYARASRGFMGKTWDGGDIAFRVELWAEVWRVLKPGGHLAAFSATRTYHRMACAIEDAGFEIRDQLAWMYGTGFPKSLDVSKAIDKAAGAAREMVRVPPGAVKNPRFAAAAAASDTASGLAAKIAAAMERGYHLTEGDAPATEDAARWQGWGTALKPAWEPILFGSKPVTVTQHFAIIAEEITAILVEAAQWSNVNANDAEIPLTVFRAKCGAVANSVLANARMQSLASIGIAKSAARSSTFSALASIDLIRTRDCSALSHVAPNGSADEIQAQTTEAGQVADILIRLMGMSTSVMVDGMSASIARSWLTISADLLSGASRFTIETATKLTIALKTLNCSLLPSISADTGRLTPSWEPICLARKPLCGTVAENVLAHGTGAINVDGCRVGDEVRFNPSAGNKDLENRVTVAPISSHGETAGRAAIGRWPANICHDGSDEVLAAFPFDAASAGPRASMIDRGDSGSAARFFFSAKAGRLDRLKSKHPTVKPVELMRWLVRMVTPPGGVVLDPFAGTGTTGAAAYLDGFSAVLVEREAEYRADIAARIRMVMAGPDELARALAEPAPHEDLPLFGGDGAAAPAGGANRLRALRGRQIGPTGLKG